MISAIKKIIFLITKRQKKGLIALTLLLFVGMILEIFGLGILIPALSILLDPELLDKTPIILLLFLVSIVLVYFIKSLFLIFLTHKHNRFINNITAKISNNLFYSYLSQPYIFHLNRNASELIKNIQVEINYLQSFLYSLISIFIEGGFVLSILAALVYIEPLGAISIGIFYGILSKIFLQFTKKKLNHWGNIRIDLDAQLSKTALEALGGIKDLLILGTTSFYVDFI